MIILSAADFHITCLKKMLKEKAYLRAEKALMAFSHAIWEHHPDAVTISGDIFDSSHPSKDEIHLFNKFLLPILREGIHVFIIPGNHDSFSENNNTALNFLEPFDDAIENFHLAVGKFKYVVLKNTLFLMWPWGVLPSKKDLEEISHLKKTYTRIGILHITLANTIVSEKGFVLKKGYTKDSLREAFKLFQLNYAILGDIHEYQTVIENKAFYPGSLYQTKFNESPNKGIIYIDTAEKECSFVELTDVPKLLNITLEDGLAKLDENNFYTLIVNSKEDYFKISNTELPENVVNISYPFGKIATDKKVIESNRKMGFSISVPQIMTKVLKKQGVKDIRGTMRYLFKISKSKNDLILP